MDLTRRSPMFTSSSFTSSYTTSTTSLLILLLCFSVQLTAARNFVHSRDEIKLTAHVTIAQTNCAKNETPIFVHTAAVTEGKYFDRRMTIRKTWAREAKEANLKVSSICPFLNYKSNLSFFFFRSSSSLAFRQMLPHRRKSNERRPPTATCSSSPSPRTTSTSP